MAKITIDGNEKWKGPANHNFNPAVDYVPAAPPWSKHTVRVARLRVLGVNIVKSIRITVDDNVAYDEGY